MVRWTLVFFAGVGLFVACSGSKDAVSDGGVDPTTTSNGGTTSSNGGTSSGTTSGAIAPGEPRVAYSGRLDTSDESGPTVGWGGTKVFVRFEGTALSISINESETSDGGSRYDISVDGKTEDTPLGLTDGMQTYEIVKGLAAGTHVVVLTRRTEPQVGVSQFLDFTFPNGGKLLAPPAQSSRHIEFVGDSEMAGYGIECADKSESFTADTENETKTYPELVGATLSAEVHNLAYSGKGVYRNGTPGGDRYGVYYPQSVPRVDPQGWDFSWKPDVVWMSLGANDYDPGPNGDRPAPSSENFENAFRTLLDAVRTKNPDAKIVLVVQAFVNDDYPEGYRSRTNIRTVLQALVDEHHRAGDANVFFEELPQATDADLTGCDSHPNAGLHERLAGRVSARIAEIAGWK